MKTVISPVSLRCSNHVEKTGNESLEDEARSRRSKALDENEAREIIEADPS